MQLNIVYAEFDMICLVIMLMITLKTVSLSNALRFQRLYLWMMSFCILLAASDGLYEFGDAGLLHYGEFCRYALNILYFASSILIGYLWHIYAQRVIGVKRIDKFLYRLLVFLPSGVLIALSFTTYYTHFVFYFDETGYHRGTINDIYMIIPLLYFLVPIFIVLFNLCRCADEKNINNLKTVVGFAVFPVAFVIIQAFFQGFPAIVIGASLGMLQVFLNNIATEREDLIIQQTASKSKNDFFAGMSHEIRTPINAILGMNTMILRESQEASIREYAGNIDNSGKLLLRLVNDILDISKIEAGMMKLIPTEYNLKTMIRDLVRYIEPRVKEKGISLNVSVDENLPSTLVGDEVRVRQVVLNVLSNAVKYTDEGVISLKISLGSIDLRGADIRFEVKDTGCGMKEEELYNLFAPYERFNESTNRKIEGTGLGMSISKQLLVLMGSKMEVASEFGVGSTFSFTINQKVVDATPIGKWDLGSTLKKSGGRYKPSFTAPNARILAVDDTAVNLTVFKALLKQTKMTIETASSGAEAVSKADNIAYDIMFIDIMMPEMDGVETLNNIKSLKSGLNKDTIAVALTANALSGAKEEYLSEGYDDYLPKPIEAAALEEMMIKYLPKDLVIK